MKRVTLSLLVLVLIGGLSSADQQLENRIKNRADGDDEILVVVNGTPITYQEIVGNVDMQAEITTFRSAYRIDAEITDQQIEKRLVMERLQTFVVQQLLDDEADRVQLNINDAQMRGILARERKRLGLEENDVRAWALYLKERVNLSPTEYRERRREEIRRNEMMNYMAGLYGPLPKVWPLEIYFSLSVTPRDVRNEFEATSDKWRIAKDIDYRQFKLLYPADIGQETKQKLASAVYLAETSVHARVQNRESMDVASKGLEKLIEDLAVPGVRIEITDRETVKDDTQLDPLAYDMVLSVPASGGVSEVGGKREEDEDGTQLEVIMFIRLFSREDGDQREYESPAVQESIRERVLNERLALNRVKVQQELLRRAAIVPDRLFRR